MSVTVNNSPFQDYSSCMLIHPTGDHVPLTYQMTPGFKHFTVLHPAAITSSGYLMTTKSLVCGVIIVC